MPSRPWLYRSGAVQSTAPVGIPFEVGKLYHRQGDIHQVFGGQERGGISTPDGCPFVFLFTGESGEQFGYSDGWRPDGIFAYTGEGQMIGA
jgi:5-methylcytosine-specific restriction enzyme A